MDMDADEAFGGSRAPRLQRSARALPARPDRRSYDAIFEAGADVVETDSFTASRLKLDEYGLGERTVEINRRSAAIARAAADRFARPSGRASSRVRSGRPAC
jgi:S-methylmethionine-dependent homocysteine/selenocysteine methylase